MNTIKDLGMDLMPTKIYSEVILNSTQGQQSVTLQKQDKLKEIYSICFCDKFGVNQCQNFLFSYKFIRNQVIKYNMG